MADRQSTSSQFVRPHASTRSSHSDAFSDGFALRPFSVADGFRPASTDNDDHRGFSPDPQTAETPRQSTFSQSSPSTPIGLVRRSNLSQRSTQPSWMISRRESRASQLSRSQSITSLSDDSHTASTPQRSSRSVSTFGFSRAQSPYQGPSGPSQPYGMYSQDIALARTPSVATTSTIRRPEGSYTGPSGPTQPYGLYPQNTVPVNDQNPFNDAAYPITAGFSGSSQTYQRRLGPDGEDVDDLIGPDGYTEQLPPYTRYANGIPPKLDSTAANIPPHVPGAPNLSAGPLEQQIASQVAPQTTLEIPPPILPYIAPQPPAPVRRVHNDAEVSEETLHRPQSRDSPIATNQGAVNPFADNSTQVSSSDPNEIPKEEDGSFQERIKRHGRRRACGGIIPCWLLILFLLAIFFSVLMGGVIGGLLARRHGVRSQSSSQPSATTTAAPVATVTATNAMDAVPLSSIPPNLAALPTGLFSLGLQNPTTATNSCLTTSGQGIAWDCETSAQLSIQVNMIGPNAPVISVTYPSPPNAPIRYGAQPPSLGGPTNLSLMQDRSAFSRGPAYHFQQQYNKTVILRQSDLPGGYQGQYAKRSLTPSIKRWFGLEERGSGSSWTDNNIAKPTDKPWYCFWNGTIIEGFIYIQQPNGGSSSAATSASSATSTQTAPQLFRRQSPPPPPAYPKAVRIDERRVLRNPIQPYCVQMQIMNNAQPSPLADPNGNPYQILLTELEPLQQKQLNQNGPNPSPSPGQYAKRQAKSNCQCEWSSG